jgi:hypothetical protein
VPETERAHQEAAHDVLAAEAFAVPAADPQLQPGPMVVPEDPTGIAEPHDVLAAEEFPMPAGRPSGAVSLARRARGWPWGMAVGVALGLVALRVLRRLSHT